MSKLKGPDFLNIFQNYDILFFQETKTDNLDHLSLRDGFTYVAKHRKKCLRKSGGTVTISYVFGLPSTITISRQRSTSVNDIFVIVHIIN
jgi:hypothetical protein